MELLAVLGFIGLAGYYVFRFFDGDLTIESTEIKEYPLVNEKQVRVGIAYHIITTFKSGRIKITQKQL